MKRIFLPLILVALAALPACHSNIEPLRPVERAEYWLPDDGGPAIQLTKPIPVPPAEPALAAPESTTLPAEVHPIDITATSAPATQPATTAATTIEAQPATQASKVPIENQKLKIENPLPPGHLIVKIIDPNQSARFVYHASYDNIWQQATLLINQLGFAIDRRDYRLGVLTTQPLPSSQIVEFWKPQHSEGAEGVNDALENTVNSQRRYIRLTISKVPAKPDFYQIAVQVIVERETNPTESLTGPLFVEGSGFGRNTVALRSDYADPTSTMSPKRAAINEEAQRTRRWVILGHDPDLEKKLLDQLFNRI